MDNNIDIHSASLDVPLGIEGTMNLDFGGRRQLLQILELFTILIKMV